MKKTSFLSYGIASEEVRCGNLTCNSNIPPSKSNGDAAAVIPPEAAPMPDPFVKRNNNQVQLRNFAGGEGRWSVEENSLIPDDEALTIINGQDVSACQQNVQHPNSSHAAVKASFTQNNLINTIGKDSNCQQNLDRKQLQESGVNLHRNIQNDIQDTTSVGCLIDIYATLTNNCLPEQNYLSNGMSMSNSTLCGRNVSVDDKKLVLSSKSKINNNVCPNDKPNLVKDGMDEYFKECHVMPGPCAVGQCNASLAYNIQKDLCVAAASGGREGEGTKNHQSCDMLPKPLTTTTITTATIKGGTTREVRAYNTEQLNLLNGDDYEDEDGCIYTYKEVPGFEDNLLDHLLNTCVSCGLPNLDLPKADLSLEKGGSSEKASPDDQLNDEAQENLFSPDMDFLEMDFDPGSNAEDLESSDCDDNCYPGLRLLSKECGGIFNGSVAASSQHRKHESNNLSPERQSLMLCRRCEIDSVGVGNLSGDVIAGRPHHVMSSVRTEQGLDDRPSCIESKSGAISKKIDNTKVSSKSDSAHQTHSLGTSNRNNGSASATQSVISGVNVNCRQSEAACKAGKLHLSSVSMNSQPNIGSNLKILMPCQGEHSVENNLEHESVVMDAGGEDADDEREDSSPSECKTLHPQHHFNIKSVMPCHGEVPPLIESPSPEDQFCGGRQSKCGITDFNVLRDSVYRKVSCGTPAASANEDITILPKEILTQILPGVNRNKCVQINNNNCPNRGAKSVLHTNCDNIENRNNMNKDCKPVGDLKHDCNVNNNLGSLSAPEVSPAHEHPHHEKFKRSISFHNQLSSPKYDNVCFVPHRNLLGPEENCLPPAAIALEFSNISSSMACDALNKQAAVNSYLRSHRHSHPCNEHLNRRWNGSHYEVRRQDGNADLLTAKFSATLAMGINTRAKVYCPPPEHGIVTDDSTINTDRRNIHAVDKDVEGPSYNKEAKSECSLLQLNRERVTQDSYNGILSYATSPTEYEASLDTSINTNAVSGTSCHHSSSTSDDMTQVLSSSANVSACSSRLHSRETALFNISPADTDVPVMQPLSQRLWSPGQGDEDRLGTLVVKGSLPPKTSDPALDVNTTPVPPSDREPSCPRIQEKVMVWTERQATARQVQQQQRSACGLTALALDQRIPPATLSTHVRPRLRAEGASLVQYLVSRASAGTIHQDLIDGMAAATRSSVVAKFFPMYPKRAVQLSRWLADWIAKGGVCVCTLNLQRGGGAEETIPDAWHHQMVFGVGPQGIYLTNPVECVCEEVVRAQVCSDSVLLVRREDVLRHWTGSQSLHGLLQQQDPRWRDMNVLGQVALVLKEEQWSRLRRGGGGGSHQHRGRHHTTSHVCIPAAYTSGVTVFMRSDNAHCAQLLVAEEPPLLE